MKSVQTNIDEFFDKNDNGVEDAKTTTAHPSIMVLFNRDRKAGENPILYLKKYTENGEEKYRLGVRSLGRINTIALGAKQIAETQNSLSLQQDGETANYYFSPIDIIPHLIDQNITTEDLYPLYQSGFFRNIRFSPKAISRGLKRSYFFARNQQRWNILERERRLEEARADYDNMYGFNPRRVIVQRQIARLESELEEFRASPGTLINKYLKFDRLSEEGKITEENLPYLGRLLGLFLSHPAGGQTATYPDNDLKRQNDWFDLLENHAAIVIDGTGHGDPNWYDVEVPVYKRELVSQLNKFLVSTDQIEYTEGRLGDYTSKWVDDIYEPFSVKYIQMLDERKELRQREQKVFNDKFDELIELATPGPDGEGGIYSDEFWTSLDELLNLLDFPILREELISVTRGEPRDKIDIILRNIVQNIDDIKVYSDLFEELASFGESASNKDKDVIASLKRTLIRGIKTSSARTTDGSAMNLVIPFHAVDMHYVITFVIADTCTIFFEPTDDFKSLQLRGNMFQTGGELGDVIENFSKPNHTAIQSWRLDRGGAYLSFTDGIGEFLSVNTIVKIFIENYENGPEELLLQFTEAIYNKIDLGKYQASSNPKLKVRVKEYDPDSRGGIDDIAFAYGFIRPALIN